MVRPILFVRGGAWHSAGMLSAASLLVEIRDQVERRAGADPRTIIDGFLISRHERSDPDYQLTEPLVVVMAQGSKRLYFGEEVIEYGAGDCLIVTTSIPISGHFIDASPQHPALAVGLSLNPGVIAELLPRLPDRKVRSQSASRGIDAYDAGVELLDPVARLMRLLDRPDDLVILAPMIEREIHWHLLTGSFGATIAQVGLADSNLAQINRATAWIRGNLAAQIHVPELARMAGMSESSFHRHFRAITGMTPLQFQKHLRLQQARSLLLAQTQNVTEAARTVGYGSPTQFNREYRRLFGQPPHRDIANLRRAAIPAGSSPQR